MGAQGIVVQPGQGPVANYAPGRSIVLKLLGEATGGSIMMFEASAPVGAKSTLHLHHDSDEVAYVLRGEFTFLIGEEVTIGGPGTSAFMPRGVRHAWKNTGAQDSCVLFLYTPGAAGALIEEQQRTGSGLSTISEAERADLLRRHSWELLGPSPL